MLHLLFLSSCMTSARYVPGRPYEALRFIVYGSTSENESNTVSGKITVLDTSGNEISSIERSWPGSYLSLEFCTATFDSKKYFFPYRVKGLNTIMEKSSGFNSLHKGTNLYPYFMENGECILYSPQEGASVRRGLYKIARFASWPLFFKTKYASFLSVDLSRCESGVFYSLFVTEDGKLSVVRE